MTGKAYGPVHDFANNIPLPNDTTAMKIFNQTYNYDEIGNLLEMKSVGQWTTEYVYDFNTNNYLLKHDENATINSYEYDTVGEGNEAFSLTWASDDWKFTITGIKTLIDLRDILKDVEGFSKLSKADDFIDWMYEIGAFGEDVKSVEIDINNLNNYVKKYNEQNK